MRPLRILVAPGAFKETLSPSAAADAMEAGLRSVDSSIEIRRAPLADGGDGTLEAWQALRGGRRESVDVTGPLGERRRASFLWIEDGATAVIEMAEASGLRHVPPDRRDPRISTSAGTGDLIRAALDRGARRILIGLGGSATVDGGVGMAAALGIRFLDSEGRPVGLGGDGLDRIARIERSGLDSRLAGADLTVLSDVRASLLGPEGAARAFGPQKGADPATVDRLEEALRRFADRVETDAGRRFRDQPGAGAAGGLGFALASLLGAHMKNGASIFLDDPRFTEALAWADAAVTGEGRIDATTLQGKGPGVLLAHCESSGVPAILVCGTSERPDAGAHPGTAAMATLTDEAGSTEAARAEAPRWAARSAARALRRLLAVGGGTRPVPPPPPVILASGSTGRAELLRAWHHRILAIEPTETDEIHPERETDLRRTLVDNARAKAAAWRRRNPGRRVPGSILVAADTLTLCDGRIQGKAPDRAAALNVLRSVRGKPQQVLSAVWVEPLAVSRVEPLDRTETEGAGGIAEATVRLRPDLTDDDLRAYLATGKGDGKAGSFAIDPAGDPFFELLEGEMDTVIGLSRNTLNRLIHRLGDDNRSGRKRTEAK